MKRKISFLDKDHNRVIAEIELEHNKKNQVVFSMSGDYKNSSGQCFDDVKPANKYQKQLINLWRKHHLNDLHAGTKEQEKRLKQCKSTDYQDQCEFLKKIGLFEVKLSNGKLYKYGHGWLYNELHENFEETLNEICYQIEHIENQEKEHTSEEKEKIKDKLHNEKIRALKEVLDLLHDDILYVDERNDKMYTVNGVDYYVLTEDDAVDLCEDYLEKYSWIEAIKADRTELSFEEWQEEVIKIEGFGMILNGYDGSEDMVTIEGTEYYVIRCK